jgi:3',5'-cyclic AMP phosphodiesterase CpdA
MVDSGSPRVLIVEDDLDWQKNIIFHCEYLRKLSAEREGSVVIVDDYQSVKERLGNDEVFDLAITDVFLKGKGNQFEWNRLARLLQKKSIPIVIVSGLLGDVDQITRMVNDFQVVGVFHKAQLDPYEFSTHIKKILSRSVNHRSYANCDIIEDMGNSPNLGDTYEDNPNSVSILHLSDLHFGQNHRFEESNDLPPKDNPTLHKVLVRSLKRDQKKPDIIVVSGDLAQSGDPAEFGHARGFLESLRDELGLGSKSVVVVPGNHDLRWNAPDRDYFGTYRDFCDLFYGSGFLREPFSYVNVFDFENRPPVAVVGLDSCVIESPKTSGVGYVGSSQIESALRELREKTEGREYFRIAVLHHHLIPVTSLRNLPDVGRGEHFSLVMDSASILSKLQHEGFNLILHGHQHQPFYARVAYGNSDNDGSLNPMAIMGMGSAGVRIENQLNYYGVIQINKRKVWEASVSWYRSEADPENTFVSDRQFSVAW